MRTIDYDNLESLLVRYQETHEQKLTRAEVKLIDSVLFDLAEMSNNGWISVKDRLPENGEKVLICLCDRRRRKISNYPDGKRITIRIDKIVKDYGEPFWAKGNTPSVIAWVPLPQLPKEEKC